MLKLPRQASTDYLFKRKINNLAIVSRNRSFTEEILNGKLHFFLFSIIYMKIRPHFPNLVYLRGELDKKI